MAPLKSELLGGPYHPPPLRRGDRTTCLLRDAEVVITSWTDAPISWPRCQRGGVRGGSGLLVTEELVRAIRTESSLAIQYWWGVRMETVWRWRKAFGVTQWGTEGSRGLHQSLGQKGAARVRGKKLPGAVVKRRLEIRAQHGFKLPKRWAKNGWQQWQLDPLGTTPDAEVAARIGASRLLAGALRNSTEVGRMRPTRAVVYQPLVGRPPAAGVGFSVRSRQRRPKDGGMVA